MKLSRQTLFSSVLVLCMFSFLVVAADFAATTTHITNIRDVMALCEETMCVGNYVVLNDDRVFRIDAGEPFSGEPQVISRNELLSHKDNPGFLLNVKEIILQDDRGQWLFYAKRRSEQIEKLRCLPSGKTPVAS